MKKLVRIELGMMSRFLPGVVIAGLAVGCGGDREIKTYKVAKEDNHSNLAHAHASEAGARMPEERPSMPHLHGDTPEGWQDLGAGRMRAASFRIAGDGGKTAEVAVIPLPGVNHLEGINIWRQELGLEELPAERLKEDAESVQVGDTTGLMVDLSGTLRGQSDGVSTAILGAVAQRNGIAWFIKMTGDRDLVAQQKGNFVSYLRSLEFHEAGHQQGAAPVQVAQAEAGEKPSTNDEKLPEGSEKPNFKAPGNWKSKAPGPMVQSAYNVEGDGGAAEVTISKFPGAVGGLVANVQRWRGQLGLPQVSEEEIKKSVEMLEVGGKKEAYLVDLKGTNVRTGKAARMVAIGVPFEGDTWFFKLMGEEAVVEKEKAKFVEFVKSAY